MISANTRAMLVTKCLTKLFVPSKDVNCLCQHPGYMASLRGNSPQYLLSVSYLPWLKSKKIRSLNYKHGEVTSLYITVANKKKKDQFGPFKLLSSH